MYASLFRKRAILVLISLTVAVVYVAMWYQVGLVAFFARLHS